MLARLFAFVFGAVYTVVGLVGFIPALLSAPGADAPSLTVDAGYGYLFNLFPVNALHNVVHLVIGLLGLLAARNFFAARAYARTLGIVYILLAILGLLPFSRTTFGLIPIFGSDVILHVLSGLLAGCVGWVLSDRAPEPVLADRRVRRAQIDESEEQA